MTKKFAPPHASTDAMFFGGAAGRLLLRSEEGLVLFDQQSRRVLGELLLPRVKYVVWSADCSHVALLSKQGVVIAGRQLEQLASVSESVRVKSGAWDSDGVFIYSTLNHIKYCLPNGYVTSPRRMCAATRNRLCV